jgi:drug/metabolite transporter (DMT)-like permease
VGKGEVWALVAAVGYALNHIFLRVALSGYDLNNMVGSTMQAVPALLLALVVGWGIRRQDRGHVPPWRNGKIAAGLLGSGLMLFVVSVPLLFGAFRTGGVLITSPVTGTQVLWGALLAALLLREPLNRGMLLGMLASVVGVIVLTLGQGSGAHLAPTWWLAVPYALGAALCWSLAGVMLTYAMRHGVDRFQALATVLMTGVVVLNVYLAATGRMASYASTPWRVLLSALAAGLFNMIALVALTSALAMTSVASATTLNSLQVGLAPLLAWLFLREDMNVTMAAGILLILVGVLVVQRAKARDQNGAERAHG